MDILRQKLEKSKVLYSELLKSAQEMDANLTRWSSPKISDYLLEAQKLQKKIQDLDLEIAAYQGTTSISGICREIYSERAEKMLEVLAILEKNKVVVSRMLTVLSDDLSKSKNFRNAAGGYFRKSRMTGRTLERTV